MAETKPGPASKKLGPLKGWQWAAVGGGIFVVYRFMKSRQHTATITTPLSGGTTIPTPGSGSSSTLPTFSSFSGWQQAAIGAMANGTLDPATALNGLTDWINGQCVSQAQYNGISSIISTVGLPPGFSNVPVLSVCAAAPPTPTPTPTSTPAPTPGSGGGGASVGTSASSPPNLAQSIVAAMTANGEHLVGAPVWDAATSTWLYLTQRGGIYALNPNGTPSSAFYGSGLSSSLGNAFTGRTAQSLTANGSGSYTITDALGSNYTFGPGAGQNYAGATVQ